MVTTKHVSFRLDDKVAYIIHDYAKFKHMTISEIVREAVLNYIEDDLDSRYFHTAVRWEVVNTRMEEVRKIYETLGLDPITLREKEA